MQGKIKPEFLLYEGEVVGGTVGKAGISPVFAKASGVSPATTPHVPVPIMHVPEAKAAVPIMHEPDVPKCTVDPYQSVPEVPESEVPECVMSPLTPLSECSPCSPSPYSL